VQQAAPEHARGPSTTGRGRPARRRARYTPPTPRRSANGSPGGRRQDRDYHGYPPEFVRATTRPGRRPVEARAELELLAAGAALGIAHSRFMERELQTTASGTPPRAALVDPRDCRIARRRHGGQAPGRSGGRPPLRLPQAPNKRIETSSGFAVYRRAWDREARLFGWVAPTPRLRRGAATLRRPPGSGGGALRRPRVADPELAAYYAGADVSSR